MVVEDVAEGSVVKEDDSLEDVILYDQVEAKAIPRSAVVVKAPAAMLLFWGCNSQLVK